MTAVNLPDRLLAQVDKVRGRRTRAGFIADAVKSALLGIKEAEVPVPPDDSERDRDGDRDKPCPHPKARVHKNFCYACGHYVPN